MVRLGDTANLFKKKFKQISIPLWFDWECLSSRRLRPVYLISIPLWFDWEKGLFALAVGADPNFNSTMVRLGVPYPDFLHLLYWDFNSTMVRLGDLGFGRIKFRFGLFQFHYGSIGRILFLVVHGLNFKISIPLWFDWELLRKQIATLLKQISIPLWFDWENNPFNLNQSANNISIPLWFDWEPAQETDCNPFKTNFNSTMVRLGEQRAYS